MTEKSNLELPHPKIDTEATKFAREEKRTADFAVQLTEQNQRIDELYADLEVQEERQAHGSWLGRKLAGMAIKKITKHIEGNEQGHYADMTVFGGMNNDNHRAENAAEAADHYMNHQGEYHDNAVALAEAEGVHIIVQGAEDPGVHIPVQRGIQQ